MNDTYGEAFPTHYEPPQAELEPYSGGYRYPATAPDGDSADIGRIIGVLREKMWLLLAAMVIGGVLGFMYSGTTSPTYRTSATVWLERPNAAGPFRATNVLAGMGWAGVFMSNTITEPVVREARLYARRVTPEGPHSIFDGMEILDEFRPGRYQLHLVGASGYELLNGEGSVLEAGDLAEGVGATRGFIWIPDPGQLSGLDEDLVFQLRRPINAANALRSRFSVRYDDMSGIIITELSWSDAQEGARIHNALVDTFIETAARLTNGRLREEVEILEEQMAYAAGKLRASELALEEFRVQAITEPGEPQMTQLPSGVVTQDPFFGSYFQQRADLDQIRNDLAELDAILSEANGGELNVLRLRQVPSILNSPVIGSIISTLEGLRLEVRTLLYTYMPEHPLVVEKLNQMNDIHRQQLPDLIAELQADLGNRATMLDQQISLRAEELREIPSRSIESARLTRQKTLSEGVHNTLLGRLNTARIAEQTALSNVQRLDSAFTPSGPETQTLPSFFVLIGSIAGLGLAVGAILVRDRIDNRIRHPEDISTKFGLPLLGVVPQLKSPESNKAAAAVAIESFRSIRTQISHAEGGDGGRILITSTTPREGKSVIAANLAISYASSGLRTLLIDSDIRRGRLHSVFGFPRSPGLTECLGGKLPVEQIIRRHEPSGLDIICSGALSSDAELIGGLKLEEFLANVSEIYDSVVLDGPPLAAGADPLILGKQCDKVVMVFRAGITSEGMARSRLGQLGNVDLPIVGAILNAVPEHAPYYDQYVNYYYYAESEAS